MNEEQYSVGKPGLAGKEGGRDYKSMDWIRYRREMFRRYGELTRKVAAKPNAFLVVIPWPPELADKTSAASGSREKPGESNYRDAERLISFAQRALGERAVIMGFPVHNNRELARKAVETIEAGGFSLSAKPLVVLAGEKRDACVSLLSEAFSSRFPTSKVAIDAYYCGDILPGVKARRIRRRTQMNKPKGKRSGRQGMKRPRP